MTPDDFARLRELFEQVMALPPSERAAFVDRSLPSTDALHAELRKMLDVADDSRFLTAPTLTGPAPDRSSASRPDAVQIGNYKVLREIARGGMGVVYLAVRSDDVFHKVVALKVIGSVGTGDSEYVHRFRQERQILAGLDHPNIARILDGGSTADGRPYYVMEYVDGSPIDEYCARTTADVASQVRMMIDACAAVEYLHAHAITHRDIKPGNILVTNDGRVKLVDFGIAKVDTVDGVVSTPSAPGRQTMIMTPGYASPEQLHGAASGKSGDIYSLAVVLYQLLSGRLPYADDQGNPNLAAQLSGPDADPPSRDSKTGTARQLKPTDSRKTSRPDLDRVVLTALQRDPARRYASVQVFAEDLRRCLEGRPITAREESVTYRFQKLIGRNRVAATLALLLAVVSLAGAWTAVSLRIERVRLEGKEDELARFVALMDARVTRWQEQVPPIPVTERVVDVQTANQVMASDSVRALSASAPDPERVSGLVRNLRGVVDRAEGLSAGLAPVQKEIALVYRQIGDFQSGRSGSRVVDKTQATTSYRRAAGVAVSLRAEEPAWASQQLSELGTRLQTLGEPLELAADEPPPPSDPAPEASGAPSAPARRGAARPARGGADPQLVADVRQGLRAAAGDAEVARRNLESLQASLGRTGQAIRPELLTSMSRADSLLEDARAALGADDLVGAEDALNRARYELRRLLQQVGG